MQVSTETMLVENNTDPRQQAPHFFIMPFRRRNRFPKVNYTLFFLLIVIKQITGTNNFRPSPEYNSNSHQVPYQNAQIPSRVTDDNFNDDQIKVVGANVGVISDNKFNRQNLGEFVKLVGINQDNRAVLPHVDGLIQVVRVGDGFGGQETPVKIKVVQGPSLGSRASGESLIEETKDIFRQPQRLPYDRPYYGSPGITQDKYDANLHPLEKLHGRDTHQVQYFVGEKALEMKTQAPTVEHSPDYHKLSSIRVQPRLDNQNFNEKNSEIFESVEGGNIQVPNHNLGHDYEKSEKYFLHFNDNQNRVKLTNVNIPGHGIISEENIPTAVPAYRPEISPHLKILANPQISQPGQQGVVHVWPPERQNPGLLHPNNDNEFYPIHGAESVHPYIANNQPKIVSSSNVQYQFGTDDSSPTENKLIQNEYPNFIRNHNTEGQIRSDTEELKSDNEIKMSLESTISVSEDNKPLGSEHNFISLFADRTRDSNHGLQSDLQGDNQEGISATRSLNERDNARSDHQNTNQDDEYTFDNTEYIVSQPSQLKNNKTVEENSEFVEFPTKNAQQNYSNTTLFHTVISSNKLSSTSNSDDRLYHGKEKSKHIIVPPLCGPSGNSRWLTVNPDADIFIGGFFF